MAAGIRIDRTLVVAALATLVWGGAARALVPILDMRFSQTHGSCAGGARPGGGCLTGHDCPGKCAGGKVPGETCFSESPDQCQGQCSGGSGIRCSSSDVCGIAFGKCTAPLPGTCSAPASGTCEGASSSLSWSAVPGATGYDIIAGDLFALHSSAGDLRPYECLADDAPETTFAITPGADVAHPSWFLVRAVSGSANGTYDEGGNQVGSRDPESGDCP